MTAFSVLKHKTFTLFVIARFLATIALQIQGVAVGWQIYQQTGSTLNLGLIGLAQFLPFALLILIAGYVADQRNRSGIVLTCFFIELIGGGLLLFFAQRGGGTVWPIIGVMVLFGVARAFMMPASQAILMDLVPRDYLAQAVALNSSLFHIAVICAPPVGGFLYLWGATTVYTVVAGLLGFAVVLMLPVRLRTKTVINKREPISWHGVLEGLRFVFSKQTVLGALSLDLLAVLFGGVTALLPAYATDILHIDSLGLGFLRGAPALGAALTGIVLGFVPISRRVGAWMFTGVFIFGFSTVLFGLSTNFYLSLTALFFVGIGDMVSVYIRHILVQLETPDAIRGRVSAVNSVFIGASNELGEFESGMSAAFLGLVPAVVMGGCMTLVVTFICLFTFPILRKMDRFDV